MGFEVRPASLNSFAKELSGGSAGLAGQCHVSAGQYVEKWSRLEDGEGGLIFGFLSGKVNEVCDKINRNHEAMAACLAQSATGLTESAKSYRAQDHASAGRLDSAYKPAALVPLSEDVDVQSPVVSPMSTLKEPDTEGGVPDLVQQILDGAGYFSESELVFKILSLCGLDVEGWVKERFVGDFDKIARSRNSIKNLADFNAALATAVSEDANKMFATWHGNAATAARSYFDRLANGIEQHAISLSNVAKRYDAIVVAIQQAGSTIMGILTGLIDCAVEAAAAVAAAGCLEEVPVLDVILDIVGAWRVVKLIQKIHELATTWNWIWSGAEGIMAITTGMVGRFASFDPDTTLPKLGYHNAVEGGR